MTNLGTLEGVENALSNGIELNPYWVLWVRSTGGGRNFEFMEWIQKRWFEFEPDHSKRSLLKVEFLKWLSEKCA